MRRSIGGVSLERGAYSSSSEATATYSRIFVHPTRTLGSYVAGCSTSFMFCNTLNKGVASTLFLYGGTGSFNWFYKSRLIVKS